VPKTDTFENPQHVTEYKTAPSPSNLREFLAALDAKHYGEELDASTRDELNAIELSQLY
jgi:hypothetical protein